MEEEKECRCPHCGRLQLFTDKICPYCGEPLGLGAEEYVTVEEKAAEQRQTISGDPELVFVDPEAVQKKRKRRWGPVLLLLVVTMLILTSFIMVKQQSTKKQGGASESQVQVTMGKAELPEPTPWGDETYYPFPAEEEMAIMETMLIYNPDLWEQVYPDLSQKDLDRMQKAVACVSDNSRQKALEELHEYGKFSRRQAEKTLDLLQVDFNIMCYMQMRSYMSVGALSPQTLRFMLEEDGFEQTEIDYALDHCPADWERTLFLWAHEWLEDQHYSEPYMLDYAAKSGFPQKQIEVWERENTEDFQHHALARAKYYQGIVTDCDYSDLLDLMLPEKFTEEQVAWAAEQLGLPQEE